MRNFDECLAYAALAKVLDIDELPLIDRMALSAEHERNNIAFSVEKHHILQSWNFFEARQYEFYFVQGGEFLMLEHLDKNKFFIAYEKNQTFFHGHCSSRYSSMCLCSKFAGERNCLRCF